MHKVMRGRSIALSIAAALLLVAGGCGSSSSSPTTPTPVTTTETFSGIVSHAATAGTPFTVGTTGTVTISLTSVAPLSTMSVGVGIGTLIGGDACGLAIAKNDNARAGATALSGTANAGSYCVLVYDSGNIPEDSSVSFEVQVVHPQ
jgi:hypothetical protein